MSDSFIDLIESKSGAIAAEFGKTPGLAFANIVPSLGCFELLGIGFEELLDVEARVRKACGRFVPMTMDHDHLNCPRFAWWESRWALPAFIFLAARIVARKIKSNQILFYRIASDHALAILCKNRPRRIRDAARQSATHRIFMRHAIFSPIIPRSYNQKIAIFSDSVTRDAYR